MEFYAHSLKDKDKTHWHLLAEHLHGTGERSAQFAAVFSADIATLARMLGLLHDLGKYSQEFQDRLQGDLSRVDHSTRGAQVACKRYRELGYLLAYAIAGHHAGLANGKREENGSKRRPLDERLDKEDLPELSPVWEEEIKLADTQELYRCFNGMQLCKGQESFQRAFLIRMLFACLIDADRLDTEKFFDQAEGKTNQRGSPHSLSDLQTTLDAFLQKLQKNSSGNKELNMWRNKILAHVREQASLETGIFSLTVPTGGGKTLTSLAFALDHALQHGLRRIIYVIPYTNIIEQTVDVFRDALGVHAEAVLEHHSALVLDAKSLQSERYQGKEKLKLAMENWDAPIIVTTAVQFFESLFASSPSKCRKLHNIAGSVIILDEAQTLPLHVLRPCVAALQELALNYRTSIVLCTATQPALGAEKFKRGFENVRELAPEREKMFNFFQRVTIRSDIAVWSDDKLRREIAARPQVLCIVNNRKHARALVDSLGDCEGVRLLTTLMCAKHRRKVLAEIRRDLEAGKPCRLVATSLVEAGVDIDFPTVLRAEAGLDSIAQAAGRCNREGKRAREDSEVIVFAPDNEKWKSPPELKQFAQVMREVLRSGMDILSHKASTEYFTQLYWQKGDKELDSKDILQTLRENNIKSLPFEKIARDFVMIDDRQQPLIINYENKLEEAIRQLPFQDSCAAFARQVQPYLVQVPLYEFSRLQQAGVLEAVGGEKFAGQFMLLQHRDLYHKDFGLSCADPEVLPAAATVI